MKRMLLAVALCALLGRSSAEPVLVRLGNLAWVAASEGLPRSIGGRMMVPPLAACDLLGLKCQLKGGSVDATGPLGRLSMELHQGLIELRPLVLITGQTLHYDPRSGAAILEAGKANTKLPWAALQSALPGQVQDVPLRVQLSAIASGHPNRTLTLSSPQSLKGLHLTLYSGGGHTLTTTGSLAPSTPDHPVGYTCAATCTLNIPRSALWTLAYLSR